MRETGHSRHRRGGIPRHDSGYAAGPGEGGRRRRPVARSSLRHRRTDFILTHDETDQQAHRPLYRQDLDPENQRGRQGL